MVPQPGSLLVPAIQKPSLTRSRSSTTPSKQAYPTLDVSAARPGSAARSHSFLSPVDIKPRPSYTLPDATSSSRLQISITAVPQPSDHHHHHPSRHRHTRSEVHGGSLRSHRRDRSEGLPHLTAGIAAERGRRAEQAKPPGELWGGSDLRRIASNRSGRVGIAGRKIDEAARLRRTNSDPKRQAQQKAPSQFDILLDRTEAQTMVSRAAVTQRDVDRIRKINAEAEAELQRRLAAVNKTSIDITRKLDYTYYKLLEKVGNLVSLVQSFQSLSTQTQELVSNFAREASTLETAVKNKLETFQTGFHERETRVRRLEERGTRATTKAQQLGARLETARQRVEAWEKREGAERRRRSRFWKSAWTLLLVVMLVGFFGLTWRAWREEVDLVRAALAVHVDHDDGHGHGHEHGGGLGRGNGSSGRFLDREVVEELDVPVEVKEILKGVVERRVGGGGGGSGGSGSSSNAVTARPSLDFREDERLRALDEL